MNARLVRVLVCLLACSIFLPDAIAAVIEPPQQEPAAAEPSGPKASPTVEKILAEASRLADAKQPLDSLKAADQALEAARQANDTAGQALAQQARAKTLQDLQRADEVLAAWQDAQQQWARAGDTPEQITALVQAGLLCVADKKSEVERLFAQGLAVAKLESPRPSAVAQALHDAGAVLGAQGQEQMGIEYLRAALAIREKLPPELLKLVQTLNALAKLELDSAIQSSIDNDPGAARARDYSARAVEIGQRVAPDSSMVAESLYMLGRCEYNLSPGDDNARLHYLAALQIQRKLAPGGSTEQVSILASLGWLEDQRTSYSASQEHLAEAVAIGEKVAPFSEPLMWSLLSLGAVETDIGDLAASREHLELALAITEKLHRNSAPALINLGSLAFAQGDFAAARDYLEKALALFLKVNHKTGGVPIALQNLASTFFELGDLVSAFEYRQRALDIYESNWGDSLSAASNLSGMGDILQAQGKLDSAADYYRRALNMQQKVGPETFDVSNTLGHLADVARKERNRTEALEYYRRSLEMGQKSCLNLFCVTDVLQAMGELAYELGDLTAAENYLRQAVDIREKSLGPLHPNLARSLNGLAITMAALGRKTDALEMALRAEKIGSEDLRMSVRTLSERQALAYEGIRASGLDVALSLTAGGAITPSARRKVLDAVIHSRALVFDELAARHRSAYKSGDPEVAQMTDELSSARAQLATLVFRGAGDVPPDTYRKLLDDTRVRKEKAERMLAEKSVAFRQDQARAQLGLKEIAAALPEGAALVAFVRYARHDLQARDSSKGAPEPVPSYAAFVVRAGKHEPEFVQLGTAHEIESLLAAWRREISRQAEATNISRKTAEDSYRRTGAVLRRRIWDPLLPALGGAGEVFVVPDGALHLVSLPSLPVGSTQYLVETRPMIYHLSTERDLVPEQSHHGEGILVVGNPAFDQAGKLAVTSNEQSVPAGSASITAATLLRGTRSVCGTFQTLHFPPLPASQQEAENIAALWTQSSAGAGTEIMKGSDAKAGNGESLQMTGADASPEAFTQYAPGKRVLHVATHGFFLEGSCESAVQRRLDPSKRDESVLPATAENPLLLSGLAFAGANRRSSAKADETDGILTAEEIAGINLEGVDWAVLSACDTGVGEIKVGEGVFGLRRAFQVAGARTVIMSLWPVEDETTKQWMGTLYREHFLKEKDTGESVRAASLQILHQRRARHQSTHPFYWGAFIAAGDWH